MFKIFERLQSEHFQGIIHSENPQSGFPKLPDVQRLAAMPGWRLLEHADHCSNTCELDSTFPKKPSCYLTYNADPSLTLGRCNNDCPHRLPQHPNRHKLLICQNPNARRTKVLNCGFVYKGKPPAPPLPGRAKARLVIKGYNKDACYLETFDPVVRFETWVC